MTDYRPPNAIATLEQACAQLEIALRSNAHWRALGQATLPANRAAHERALADNPVYHAWKLLGQALAELQAGGATGWAIRTDSEIAATTDMSREGTAPAAVPPQAKPPRVELRHVLERIRVGFDNAEPAAGSAAAADHGPAAPPAAPAIAPADIEIDEAAVSFVVREPAQPAPQPAPAAEAGPAVEARGLQVETQEEADAPATTTDTSADDDDTETEVRIVPRRT
jgi:hypothetical protein